MSWELAFGLCVAVIVDEDRIIDVLYWYKCRNAWQHAFKIISMQWCGMHQSSILCFIFKAWRVSLAIAFLNFVGKEVVIESSCDLLHRLPLHFWNWSWKHESCIKMSTLHSYGDIVMECICLWQHGYSLIPEEQTLRLSRKSSTKQQKSKTGHG